MCYYIRILIRGYIMDLQHNAPTNCPTTVTVSGETFPLFYSIQHKYAGAWAFMLVDGLPIATIAMEYGKILRSSIERAERILKSFRENDSKWLVYFPNAYGVFEAISPDTPAPEGYFNAYDKSFTLDLISDPQYHVEVYSTDIYYRDNGSLKTIRIPSLSVTNENDAHFTIFDRELINAVITQYDKRCPNKISSTSVMHGLNA